MQLKCAEVAFLMNYISLGNKFDFSIKKIVPLVVI